MSDDDRSDDTIVRLPLLPSPAEVDELRAARAGIEQTWARQAADAVAGVKECAGALGLASERLTDAVRFARAAGVSWQEIGNAVGISRQAAMQRWSK